MWTLLQYCSLHVTLTSPSFRVTVSLQGSSHRRLDTCEAVLLKGSIAHVVTLEDTSIRFSEHTVMAPVFITLNYN